jgi:hypothetical protein
MVCEAPPLSELPLDRDAAVEPLAPETFEFQAGEIEAELGAEPDVRLRGGVLVRRGDRVASAESAFFDADRRALLLSGSVQFRDPVTEITGTSAEFAYDTGVIRFEGAEFRLGQTGEPGAGSRGAAGLLQISRDGMLELPSFLRSVSSNGT